MSSISSNFTKILPCSRLYSFTATSVKLNWNRTDLQMEMERLLLQVNFTSTPSTFRCFVGRVFRQNVLRKENPYFSECIFFSTRLTVFAASVDIMLDFCSVMDKSNGQASDTNDKGDDKNDGDGDNSPCPIPTNN